LSTRQVDLPEPSPPPSPSSQPHPGNDCHSAGPSLLPESSESYVTQDTKDKQDETRIPDNTDRRPQDDWRYSSHSKPAACEPPGRRKTTLGWVVDGERRHAWRHEELIRRGHPQHILGPPVPSLSWLPSPRGLAGPRQPPPDDSRGSFFTLGNPNYGDCHNCGDKTHVGKDFSKPIQEKLAAQRLEPTKSAKVSGIEWIGLDWIGLEYSE
jgi:hypothetical protein